MKYIIENGILSEVIPMGAVEEVISAPQPYDYDGKGDIRYLEQRHIGYYFKSEIGGNMNRGYVKVIQKDNVKEI